MTNEERLKLADDLTVEMFEMLKNRLKHLPVEEAFTILLAICTAGTVAASRALEAEKAAQKETAH